MCELIDFHSDILLYIFKFISNRYIPYYQLVCKKFYNIIKPIKKYYSIQSMFDNNNIEILDFCLRANIFKYITIMINIIITKKYYYDILYFFAKKYPIILEKYKDIIFYYCLKHNNEYVFSVLTNFTRFKYNYDYINTAIKFKCPWFLYWLCKNGIMVKNGIINLSYGIFKKKLYNCPESDEFCIACNFIENNDVRIKDYSNRIFLDNGRNVYINRNYPNIIRTQSYDFNEKIVTCIFSTKMEKSMTNNKIKNDKLQYNNFKKQEWNKIKKR